MLFYLKKPYFIKSPKAFNILQNILQVLKCLVVYVMIIIVTTVIMNIGDYIIVKCFYVHSILDTIRELKSNFNAHLGNMSYLYPLIIAPIAEEIMFRLPLNMKKQSFALSIAFFAYWFSGGKFYHFDYVELGNYLRVGLGICIFCFFRVNFPQKIIDMIRDKYYHIFFYSLAVCFGIIHVINIPVNSFWLKLAIVIFTLPQIISGILFSYIRVQRGFAWCIILHSLTNFTLFIPQIIRHF